MRTFRLQPIIEYFSKFEREISDLKYEIANLKEDKEIILNIKKDN